MDPLIPIGQFAALTRLSQKALRRYGEQGLLCPARVDPESGYRYYRLDQVARARLIRLLRAADLPLAEIARFLERPTPDRIDATILALQTRQAERERVLRYVRRLLDAREEPMPSYEVQVKQTEALPYASRSAVVAIGELEPFVTRTIAELAAESPAAGPPFTLFHDPVNDEEEGRVEVCLPTAERRATDGELAAGPVAYTVVAGADTDYPAILGAYDAVADWAKRHGHDLAGPPREIYLSEPGEPTRMEIAWPIR